VSGFYGILRLDGLRVAIQLAASVLGVKVPAVFTTELEKDRGVAPLCRQIESWLPDADAAPPRLSLSPTQEDWAEGAGERRSWLRDAVRRLLRLFRKYGSNE
jgi:hypothetical protein